jgi:hypothetical protein
METQTRPIDTARRPGLQQPLAVVDVPGALLKLSTLEALTGRSQASMYRDAQAGRLKLSKIGTRCTRVTAENARLYLALLAGESA